MALAATNFLLRASRNSSRGRSPIRNLTDSPIRPSTGGVISKQNYSVIHNQNIESRPKIINKNQRYLSSSNKNQYQNDLCQRAKVLQPSLPRCSKRRIGTEKNETSPYIEIKWPECKKICLPCCDTSFQPPICNKTAAYEVCCIKKPEYHIPAYSECRGHVTFNASEYECCHKIVECQLDLAEKKAKNPMTYAVQMQEKVLGRKLNKPIKISCP